MGHEIVLPECKSKFVQLDKHLEDSPKTRDMVIQHEVKITSICSDISSVKRWIFGSSAGVILTIVLAALALAVTWGRTLEKVEKLDRMHQLKVEAQNGNSRSLGEI